MGRAAAIGELPKRPVTRAHCVAAAAVAFAYAATRGRVLAEQEEREIQRLMVSAVEIKLRMVEAKTQWLDGGCGLDAEGAAAAAVVGMGAAPGGAADGGTSLHASVVADTRYLLSERERLEKEAAKLLQQQQQQVVPGAGAPSAGAAGGAAAK
jgi:hypothetical protein